MRRSSATPTTSCAFSASGTDFHQPHGERIALLRDTGFEVEALHELYAPDGDADEVRYFMKRGWAQRWPCEEVWAVRRTG